MNAEERQIADVASEKISNGHISAIDHPTRSVFS